MAIDPAEIELTDDQKRRLAELAERTGRPWVELLADALRTCHAPSDAQQNGVDKDMSLADALARDGLLGCAKGLPPDLSTNPKYLEGFGLDPAPSVD